jgi:ankyrin repeat protein
MLLSLGNVQKVEVKPRGQGKVTPYDRDEDDGDVVMEDEVTRDQVTLFEYLSKVLLEQTKTHSINQSLWDFAMDGRVEGFIEGLRQAEAGNSPCTLANPVESSRDAMGASLIHVAYLYQNYEVGRFLVEKYPEVALKGYVTRLREDYSMNKKQTQSPLKAYFGHPLPYAGITILHLLTLSERTNDDERIRKVSDLNAEAEWLLHYLAYRHPQKGALSCLLTARVVGSFFDSDVSFGAYMGATAWHFAVCSNNRALVDIFLRFITSDETEYDHFFEVDHFGNNVLHLCILNSLEDMFTFLLHKGYEIIREKLKTIMGSEYGSIGEGINVVEKALVRQYLTHVFNHDGHTPFTLAAATGNLIMFRFLLRFQMLWHKFNGGTVADEEIDYVQGLLQLKRWAVGSQKCSLIELDGFDVPHAESQYELLHESFRLPFQRFMEAKGIRILKVPSHMRRRSSGLPYATLVQRESAIQHMLLGGDCAVDLFGLVTPHSRYSYRIESSHQCYYRRRFRRL